jgi:hypothetical protein
VRDFSYRFVPSETKDTTNTRAVVVPVARVPVGLKPDPKVSVRLVAVVWRTITTRVRPADGTVVVYVVLAVGLTDTTSLVPSASAVPVPSSA